MKLEDAKRLRQWVIDVNALGVAQGFDEIAGPLEAPDSDMLDLYHDGLTPQQAIQKCFDNNH